MLRKFINRTDELTSLNRDYHSKAFPFTVIYGRLWVGKTELIHNFQQDKPHISLIKQVHDGEFDYNSRETPETNWNYFLPRSNVTFRSKGFAGWNDMLYSIWKDIQE